MAMPLVDMVHHIEGLQWPAGHRCIVAQLVHLALYPHLSECKFNILQTT
jgi:hypothetical protein